MTPSDRPAALSPARLHERHALHAHARKRFAPIGSFVSTAPRARLLAALRQLKPQLNLRLRALARERDGQRYDVDVEIRDLQRRHLIDPWLGVKSALTFAFPPHKPGAIRRAQP